MVATITMEGGGQPIGVVAMVMVVVMMVAVVT